MRENVTRTGKQTGRNFCRFTNFLDFFSNFSLLSRYFQSFPFGTKFMLSTLTGQGIGESISLEFACDELAPSLIDANSDNNGTEF